MLLVRLFVCFVRVSFCQFSLPLGVGGWLWFVIAAVPGLLYYYFCFFILLKFCLLFINSPDRHHIFLDRRRQRAICYC